MGKYVLGIDVGTTSIKVVLLEQGSKAIAACYSLPTASDFVDSSGLQTHEQETGIIISTLNKCIALLPREKLLNVSRIGVSGQMHGVLFWKSKTGCDWQNRDFFVVKDTSQLVTWQDGRCSAHFLSSLPTPNAHLAVATGFGCATIFWFLRNRPEFLSDFSVAGTIQDYVVSMLCGLDHCVMTPHNAASWGFFNTTTSQWNTEILSEAGFPVVLLPECVVAGGTAGRTVSDWHGIPAHTPVGAALGDFQCSVYHCMASPTDAVLNIGTSAQLTYAMPGGFRPPDAPESGSPISYFPYFDESYLAVAASLNGGNALATFAGMLSSWMKDLGVEGGGGGGGGGGGDDSSLYATLNSVALGQPPSDLAVSPTLLGERHRPQLRGSVANAAAGNLSLGHVTRALCRGIVDNLTSMMPAALLGEAGVRRVLGCGSALSRNPALWEEAERALLPLPLERSQTADSAVGVAMVVCDRL
ncbi:sedoheptulokinase [Gadus chalcogrammus]|uniref:sedoheptulokinase n=1 Tax=Gadus chalcogrammus TaxID=1042646 RepID=UPI0024C339D4|nr:sedoheptulokinase [Gadus chalcogrammus]